MDKEVTLFAKLALLLFFYLFLSFFYQGLITVPTEGDSLAYHIPIARSILNGDVFSPSRSGDGLMFYPGSGEVISAVFMAFSLPLNLYNLMAWVCLAFLAYCLGVAYQLTKELVVIYAVSLTTVLSMIRLLNNQTIDIWLAVFFTGSLLLLKNPQKSLRYFLLLGISLGFLIGSKFSGPLYAGVLLFFFGRNLWRDTSISRAAVFLIPITLLGFSWYFRNLFLTGNPFYPQQVLMLSGNPNFHLMEWTGWKTLLFYPNGLLLMLFALFEEYMLWSVAPFVGIYMLTRSYLHRKSFPDDLRVLLWIGISNFLIFFILPSTGNNIITYLRYLFPAFIPLVLSLFLYLSEQKRLQYFLPVIVMNSFIMLSFTSHHPKLILIYLIIVLGILYGYPRLERRFIK